MNKLLRRTLLIAAAAGIGCVVYKEVISDKARESVKKTAATVKTSYERINEVIATVRGEVMVEEGPLPNVQATMNQWKDLGY